MRKITILLSLFFLATLSFGQVNMKYSVIADKAVKMKPMNAMQKADPVWQVTFEESTPVWTFGTNAGTKSWAVSDTTPTHGYTNPSYGGEVPPLWIYMGWRYVHDYSESGGNFAWIDGISDLLGLTTPEVCDSYIQFDGIDLSSVSHPKITFYQNYKALNAAYSFIDFSVDGGTTWTSVEINEEVEGNAYGEEYFEFIATPYIANAANVSIRFRWQTTSAVIGGYGYGWEIDDIAIVDNPDYDLKYIHGRMNFFEYYDYNDPQYSDYYHISSHYGNLPAIQYNSADALSWFNVCVQNKGNMNVTPEVTVKVLDPEMTEVFTNTVTGPSISTAQQDTIDLVETDFYLGADPMIGKYTVVYAIAIPGQDDANPNDNNDTTYFYVNNDEFIGRDIDRTSAYTGPASWVDGGTDGEMIGTDFLFLFEDEIISMDVFINEYTTPGTAIIGHIMQYDVSTEDWVDLGTSDYIELDETNIGGWLNLTFSDPVYIVYDEGYESKTLMAAIEFYYNGEGNELWIGYDPTVPASFWGTKWKLLSGSNAGQWVSITNWSRGGLNIHLNFNGYMFQGALQPSVNNVAIYPNPNNGLLFIEGVEGADIQIVNMMGQVVENITNAQIVNTVNMSKYANGTYFVKVINGTQVNTFKVNLLK